MAIKKKNISQTIELIINKSKDNKFWGHVNFDDNLIVDYARSLDKLEVKFRKLLFEWHDLKEIEFELHFDLTALFEDVNYLNMEVVAERAGIQPSLFRQYKSGIKKPSLKRAKEIEQVIHMLGNELKAVNLTVVD